MKRKVLCVCALLTFFSLLILTPVLNAQDFELRGRLHMDAFWGLDDTDEFSNGFNNRRARIGVNGSLLEKWDGRIEVDFAEGDVSPNDFRLRRSFNHGGRLWLGQFKVPQGLNELTSSNNITFIERAANSNIITDAWRMGIAYEYSGSHGGMKSMIFGRALGEKSSIEGDMPLGIALRGIYTPKLAGGTVHLGGSVVYEDLKDNRSIKFSDRPEARDSKGGKALISLAIENPNLNSTLKKGLEAAYLLGSFSLAAEYLQVNVDLKSAGNPTFGGWHLQSSYIFGGKRTYSDGTFDGVKLDNQTGAWEIGARLSYMDLNDSNYIGGKQRNITVALNHYAAANLRFMLNVIFVDVTDRPGDLTDTSPVISSLRAMYYF
ncbi:MAG: porin [Balneolaceae bacterium]|nr:porin [Balneolaceae bacterium]